MAENLRSKHAFGSEANVDAAIASGTIDAYDILFLNEKKIGWVDKNGNKVILDNKQQVVTVMELPETGEEGIIYIHESNGYTWNGTEFKSIAQTAGMDEDAIVDKIEESQAATLTDAKSYTDEKIAEALSNEVVEF